MTVFRTTITLKHAHAHVQIAFLHIYLNIDDVIQ